jgi:AcrR family transcriptional regulator
MIAQSDMADFSGVFCMTSSKEKVQSSSGNARDRLLKQAAKLFMRYGYERTTMRNIANATGIKLGSIAYYFKSKEDILYATMSAVIESGEERALATLKTSDEVENKLRSLIEVELDSFLNDTGAIVIKEWRCLNKKRRNQLIQHQQVYEKIWSDVLTECHDRGIIRSKPEIARRVLHGAFAWSDSWNGREGNSSIEELAEEIMKLITHD